VLLLYGQCGDPSQRPLDGQLVVSHHQDGFPQTTWPVSDSYFKVLVHLSPGPNEIRLEFFSTRLVGKNGSTSLHNSKIRINYLPLANSPPLHLAILIAKDSPGTYEALPERIERAGNDVEIATNKYRMVAYLWQAFTGEQMYRNGLGRRCFRLEEEWQTGSSSIKDRETGQMRNEAKVHIIRSEKTTSELRALSQQSEGGKLLLNEALQSARDYFKPSRGQTQYVSMLLLDSQWDPERCTVSGQTSLAGGGDEIRLAVHGSQALQNYPSCLEEVVPSLTDCTRTNMDGAAGSNWESATLGISTHLHEIGHMFGCPHQENGIMQKEFWKFNRTFLTREPYSALTKQQGLRLVMPSDECVWHRLDALRFRSHPCFRLVSDLPPKTEDDVHVWPIDKDRLIVTAKSGISFVEIFAEGDTTCSAWLEYITAEAGESFPKQLTLEETDLRRKLPEDRKKKPLRLQVHCGGIPQCSVPSVSQLLDRKGTVVKFPKGHTGFRASTLGNPNVLGSQPEELQLFSAYDQTKVLMSIKIYHASKVHGIEFVFEGFNTQIFGHNGGAVQANCTEFFFGESDPHWKAQAGS